jgi:hypothetical protein
MSLFSNPASLPSQKVSATSRNDQSIIRAFFTNPGERVESILSFLPLIDQANCKRSQRNWRHLKYQCSIVVSKNSSNKLVAELPFLNSIANPMNRDFNYLLTFKNLKHDQALQCSSYDYVLLESFLPKMTSVDLSKAPLSILNHLAYSLHNRCRILHVSLVNHYELNDTLLKALSIHFLNLKYLQLKGCINLTESGIEAFLRHCPHLEEIDLSRAPILSDRCFSFISTLNLPLKKIKMKDQPLLTDATLVDLHSNCPTLTSLDCRGCEQITEDFILQLHQDGHYQELLTDFE